MSHLDFAVIQNNAIRDLIRSQDNSIDEETLSDTVEGLTDLHDIAAAIVRSVLCDEALAIGIKERIKEIQERLARFEDRASKRRQIARDVMLEVDIKRITASDFTVSLRAGTPSLLVIDEARIPQTFWEPREPRLDRQALLAELNSGNDILGAQLSNTEPTLSVRVR